MSDAKPEVVVMPDPEDEPRYTWSLLPPDHKHPEITLSDEERAEFKAKLAGCPDVLYKDMPPEVAAQLKSRLATPAPPIKQYVVDNSEPQSLDYSNAALIPPLMTLFVPNLPGPSLRCEQDFYSGAGTVTLSVSGTDELLRAESDGRVFVRGKLVDTDAAVYRAFREFLGLPKQG